MGKEFKYSQKDNKYFPTIDIILRGPKRKRAFKALVDSGASFSVFRPEIAEYLGINIEKGKKLYLEGIGGRILGYLHNIFTEVAGKKFRCKIIFSYEFKVSFNLIGRDNFFQYFLITFDEKNKKLILV